MLIKRLNTFSEELSTRGMVTNSYGIARALLGIGTLLTLIFNDHNTLFCTGQEHYVIYGTTSAYKLSLFYLLMNNLALARYLAIILLIIVISGWRPRITGILHWYISYSFYVSCDFFDGGDQITAILTALLIPICLCDSRVWVWYRTKVSDNNSLTSFRNILLAVTVFVIRLQVCVIYFHAGVAKMSVKEWIDGTAAYYWFTNNAYGAPLWLRPAVISILSHPLATVMLSWGTMIFEVILAMAIMMKRTKNNWKVLLISGLLFHAGIILIHGLISFFFAMAAALVLYLVPLDKHFHFYLSRNGRRYPPGKFKTTALEGNLVAANGT